jgi:hypothetical protein
MMFPFLKTAGERKLYAIAPRPATAKSYTPHRQEPTAAAAMMKIKRS